MPIRSGAWHPKFCPKESQDPRQLNVHDLVNLVFVNTLGEEVLVEYHFVENSPSGPEELPINTIYLSMEEESPNSRGDIWYNFDFNLSSFSLHVSHEIVTGATGGDSEYYGLNVLSSNASVSATSSNIEEYFIPSGNGVLTTITDHLTFGLSCQNCIDLELPENVLVAK